MGDSWSIWANHGHRQEYGLFLVIPMRAIDGDWQEARGVEVQKAVLDQTSRSQCQIWIFNMYHTSMSKSNMANSSSNMDKFIVKCG